jgi:methylated-DNA-[protein]-cysteine S-methyltransferase
MTIDSPIGPLTIVVDDAGRLTELRFADSDALDRPASADPRSSAVAAQLREYFAGRRRAFDIELAMRGTEFQRAVWSALLAIPYGETITYSELARRIGRPAAIRAVGAANGANPVPVIVPCHRVIGANGTLTGYGGGIERMQWLLALEGRRLF